MPATESSTELARSLTSSGQSLGRRRDVRDRQLSGSSQDILAPWWLGGGRKRTRKLEVARGIPTPAQNMINCDRWWMELLGKLAICMQWSGVPERYQSIDDALASAIVSLYGQASSLSLSSLQ